MCGGSQQVEAGSLSRWVVSTVFYGRLVLASATCHACPMSAFDRLVMHPFVLRVLKAGVAVSKKLGDRAPVSVVPDYARDPDEHEFFVIGVAASMSRLLALCSQLERIPVLLGNHRQTRGMEDAGITRESMLRYHLENYVIRTQGLLDRVCKLVDAVFHLTNDPRYCKYDVLFRNVKVRVSEVREPLKMLRDLLQRYAGVRNEVIHQHSIDDDDLRRLELYHLVHEWESVAPSSAHSNIKEHIRETVREILRLKRRELAGFNDEIAAALVVLLDKLESYYTREENTLRLRLSKSSH
jgi:hypothetical protein